MLTISSIRDAALATLLLFGSSCVVVHDAPPSSAPAAAPKSERPGPAAPKALTPQGQGKPLTPKPAPGEPKPAPSKPKPTAPPAARPKPPRQSEPTPTTTAPAPTIADNTAMVVPIRVAFADAVARIDAQILKTQTQGWRTVSDPKAATKVEVRYTAWRDPIQAKLVDHTLHVDVVVRYAADVRASARNPLGKGRIWITKGESWGTKAEPQKIAAKFHAEFKIEDDLRVTAKIALDDLDHGKAPTGDVCVKALVSLCVSKESIAPLVHKNLEKQLVPQIQGALASADKQIEAALDLKPQAQKLWAALQRPQPLQGLTKGRCPAQLGDLCGTPAWLVVRPESIGISQPRMDGADLRVDLAFAGQIAVQLGDEPKVATTPLPTLTPITDPPGFAVHARLAVPLSALTAELSARLQDLHVATGAEELIVTQVTLVDKFDPRDRRRLAVVVSVRGAMTADLVLFGNLEWDAARRELYVKGFDYSLDTDNKALEALSARQRSGLKAKIAAKARWKLDSRAAALGGAITDALDTIWQGHLDVEGGLDQVRVDSVTRDKETLQVDVVLAGQLGVKFVP